MPARNEPLPTTFTLHRNLVPDRLYPIGALFGPEGAWHRVRTAIAIEESGPAVGGEAIVETLHGDLVALIGGCLAPPEFETLEADANEPSWSSASAPPPSRRDQARSHPDLAMGIRAGFLAFGIDHLAGANQDQGSTPLRRTSECRNLCRDTVE